MMGVILHSTEHLTAHRKPQAVKNSRWGATYVPPPPNPSPSWITLQLAERKISGEFCTPLIAGVIRVECQIPVRTTLKPIYRPIF